MAYQIDYAEQEVPANAAYFHAQFRRARTDLQNPYVILDGVRGRGRYVGTFLAWTQREKGWFGEGEIKFFLDGDQEFPTICGTGTEDYFCGSYGFPQPFSGPYSGTTLPANDDAKPPSFWSLYRWHIMDPICFEQDLRVTIQALGWEGKIQEAFGRHCLVAFWYQSAACAVPAAAVVEGPYGSGHGGADERTGGKVTKNSKRTFFLWVACLAILAAPMAWFAPRRLPRRKRREGRKARPCGMTARKLAWKARAGPIR